MRSISIVIPHYNGSEQIQTLLDSVPAHDLIQVYIVDDHSSDAHFEKVRLLADQYERVTVLKVPDGLKGPGVARNYGVEKSQADWILFADADDYFLKDTLIALEQVIDSDADMVVFPPTSVVESTGQKATRHLQYLKLFNKYRLTGNTKQFFGFYAPWSKLVRRDLIIKHDIRFDNGIGGEDNIFSLKTAYYAHRIEVSESEIYCVVESDTSMMGDYTDDVLQNLFAAMCRYNDFLKEHGEKAYQAPMLGWILKGRQISIFTVFKWFWLSIKRGYPVSPHYYFK